MKINEIIEKLNLEVLSGLGDSDLQISGVYIGDLLSLVMAKAKEGNLWITIQTHINIVAVADLLELGGILVVENMEVEADTIKKASELGLCILKSKESAYEMACKLHELGL
jgi:hypothetical protein